MSKQKNEIQVKQVNAPAQFVMDAELMGSLSRAESSDFDIPRLILVQPTSKVGDAPGEIYSSLEEKVVVSKGQTLNFVPVAFVKDFSIKDAETGKWKRNELKTAANAAWSLFDNRLGKDADGSSVKREERINLFIVMESDLSEAFPRMYRMVLKPSSFKDAKKLMSEWDLQIRQGLPPFSFMWALSTEVITNEKGKFAVYHFNKDLVDGRQRQVTAEGYQAVSFWVKTLAQNKAKVVADEVVEDIERSPEAFEAGKLNY